MSSEDTELINYMSEVKWNHRLYKIVNEWNPSLHLNIGSEGLESHAFNCVKKGDTGLI